MLLTDFLQLSRSILIVVGPMTRFVFGVNLAMTRSPSKSSRGAVINPGI